MERIILTRLSPVLEPHIPVEQAAFRPKRDTSEQVLALTSLIESGYEKKLRTGAVFIDLSAAYDTIWQRGLMLKLARIIRCRKTLKLLNKMTGRRTYHVLLGNDTSNTKKIKNGVPQGSVLAPTLFNVYISDTPETTSVKLGYADDLAIAYQSKNASNIENVLSEDIQSLHTFFNRWYLETNTTKTVATQFHLSTHHADQTLQVQLNNAMLPSESHPKYLGVTLDRSLTYKRHLENTAQKLKKRNSLISKLAGTSWGASQTVLRTSSLALCYSVAEYCAPVWSRSAHVNKIDTQLNHTMRIITGTLKSTPTLWLPTMSAIAPPHLRREKTVQNQHIRIRNTHIDTPLKTIIENAPTTSRLKSRNPFHKSYKPDFNLKEAWRTEWREDSPRGGELVEDPTTPLPGFYTLPRCHWTAVNRIRSRHGRTAANLHRWGYRDSPLCPACRQSPQDMDHMVEQCPDTAIPGGYRTIHEAGSTFTNWIMNNHLEV